ncbi:MAG: hypothetical protein MRQ07_05000 [Candidatus Midichloria sp.]|nr:hypothetical protein [Candidatus Midichloria sp.]
MIIIIAIPAACFIVYGMESGGGITEYYRILTQLPIEMKTPNFTQENIGLFLSLIFYSLLPLTEETFIQEISSK